MQNHSGEQLDLSSYKCDLKQKQIAFNNKYGGKKVEYSYQELGIDMQQYFGKNVWYLFHKYKEQDIREAFAICQKKNIRKIPYLIGCIKHRYSGF